MSRQPLTIPALFSQMGDWKYYNTVMRLADAAEYIDYAKNISEIRPGKQLSDMIQRALGHRTADIADYLLKNEDRFFNALVVAVYDGDPKWQDFDIQENETRGNKKEISRWMKDAFGFLQFTGSEKLFPLDGQHRLAGIQTALKSNPNLADEKIAVIFVSHHANDAGRRRTRKLFSTLNKTAVNVGKSDLIALDETDTAAIITRRLVEEHKCFNAGQVYAKYNTANLPANDSEHFLTIITLYDLVSFLLGYVLNDLDNAGRIKLRYFRQSDTDLEKHYRTVAEFFEMLIAEIPSLKLYFGASKKNAKKILQSQRHTDLNVLYRAVGLKIFLRTIHEIIRDGETIHAAILQVSRLPTSFTSSPYVGVLYDRAAQKIIGGRVRVTSKLVLHMLGFGPEDDSRLRRQMASIKGIDISKVRLPRKLRVAR